MNEPVERRIEDLSRRLADLAAEAGKTAEALKELSQELVGLKEQVSGRPSTQFSRMHPGAARDWLLQQLSEAGVSMTRVTPAVYRTWSGSRVAMPFSKDHGEGRWWLGCQMAFDQVVLLCEQDDEIELLHLTPELLREHLPALSRDSAGRVKIHVDGVRGRFLLRVGYGESVPLQPVTPAQLARRLGAS